jgi:OmpA-OmpF porin, OOP family
LLKLCKIFIILNEIKNYKTMSKKTLYLLGMLLTILLGTWLYWKFCCCYCSDEKMESAVLNETNDLEMKKFELKTTNFDYQCSQNFRFLKNDFKSVLPIGDSINLGLDGLKTFFTQNPNKKLMITGYATSDEKNTSAFPNLGFARANDIKNYFVSRGFSANMFDTNGEVIEKWRFSNDTILGPNNFKFFEVEKQSEKSDWVALKQKLNSNPLVLYFNTNQSEINLSAEERQKVTDLVHYLDNVPDSKISAIGHSDGVGKRDSNMKLGLERANFAKVYLEKNGVLGSKIETDTKGPDEPIAPNNTNEGKSKNRRTVITIQ